MKSSLSALASKPILLPKFLKFFLLFTVAFMFNYIVNFYFKLHEFKANFLFSFLQFSLGLLILLALNKSIKINLLKASLSITVGAILVKLFETGFIVFIMFLDPVQRNLARAPVQVVVNMLTMFLYSVVFYFIFRISLKGKLQSITNNKLYIIMYIVVIAFALLMSIISVMYSGHVDSQGNIHQGFLVTRFGFSVATHIFNNLKPVFAMTETAIIMVTAMWLDKRCH